MPFHLTLLVGTTGLSTFAICTPMTEMHIRHSLEWINIFSPETLNRIEFIFNTGTAKLFKQRLSSDLLTVPLDTINKRKN